MTTDAVKNTNDLTRAFTLLNQEVEGSIAAFGRFGGSDNKIWTIFARFASGSLVWKLQNYARAFSNMAAEYTKLQEKQQNSLIENLDGIMELTKLHKKLKDQMNDTEGSDLYKSLIAITPNEAEGVKKLVDGVYKGVNEQMLKRTDRIKKQLMEAINPKTGPIGKVLKKFEGVTFADVFGGEVAGKPKLKADGTPDRRYKLPPNEMKMLPAYDNLKKIFSVKESLKRAKGIFKNKTILEKIGTVISAPFKGMAKMLGAGGKVFQMLGKFLAKGLMFFVNFMIYFLAIALGIAALVTVAKAFWPQIQAFVKFIIPMIKLIGEGIFKILKGVFMILGGAFTGDFKKIFDGAILVLKGLLDVAIGAIALSLSLTIGLAIAAIGAIGANIIRLIMKLPFMGGKKKSNARALSDETAIDSFASGGNSSGGWALVGERGAEFVRLPTGSRVFNNQQSKGMGGNTINVHVSGRVGASDSEIKDIANKVAREINLKMNRTATNSRVM
jgi:hypothetical protein